MLIYYVIIKVSVFKSLQTWKDPFLPIKINIDIFICNFDDCSFTIIFVSDYSAYFNTLLLGSCHFYRHCIVLWHIKNILIQCPKKRMSIKQINILLLIILSHHIPYCSYGIEKFLIVFP